MSNIFYIPIDFCPKCKNKKIIVVQGKNFEHQYSLTGKCIKKTKFPDTTYTLLKCNKCGWKSGSWNEAGFENEKEYRELEKLYLENLEEPHSKEELYKHR